MSSTPDDPAQTGSATQAKSLQVLVYSDDANVRSEVATEPIVIEQLETGLIDLAILDGEAVPVGGLGIAKQVKDEIYRCPPVLVLTGRPQDAWLATWSRAEAAVPHPIDPLALVEAATRLLRTRVPA